MAEGGFGQPQQGLPGTQFPAVWIEPDGQQLGGAAGLEFDDRQAAGDIPVPGPESEDLPLPSGEEKALLVGWEREV